MSDASLSPTDNRADQINEMRQSLTDFVAEAARDGLSPEEIATIERITAKIEQLEAAIGQGDQAPTPGATISGSVGQGGQNAPEDVATVQGLLNDKGASPALEVDGQVGPKTVQAIGAFQQQALGFADGRVDPGGQTWAVLSGGGAPPAATPAQPGGVGAVGGFEPETPGDAPPPPGSRTIEEIEEEEQAEPDEAPPGSSGLKGLSFFSEKFVTVGPLTIKTQYDAQGKLKGVEAEEVFAGGTASIPLGVASLSAGLQLLNIATAIVNEEGPICPVSLKVSLKGFGSLTVGSGAAVSYELALEGYSEARTVMVNIEDPLSSTSDVPNPMQIFLKASGDAKIVFGADKIKSETGMSIIKVEYDKLVIATIRSGPDITLEKGPGWDQFNSDVEETLEFAERNPDAAGTGPTVGWNPADGPEKTEPTREKLEADAMGTLADNMQLTIVREIESHLATRRAALADPNVVGGANSMNNKDPSRAATLYGALWQQRTDAIAAATAYVTFENAGSGTPEGKIAEARALADRCDAVRNAFRAADAQWGYGKTTVWADEEKTVEEEAPPPAEEEEETSVVDDMLDYFGFDGEEEK